MTPTGGKTHDRDSDDVDSEHFREGEEGDEMHHSQRDGYFRR